jgi:hypothetical protein
MISLPRNIGSSGKVADGSVEDNRGGEVFKRLKSTSSICLYPARVSGGAIGFKVEGGGKNGAE